jgi:hypothetical protein
LRSNLFLLHDALLISHSALVVPSDCDKLLQLIRHHRSLHRHSCAAHTTINS